MIEQALSRKQMSLAAKLSVKGAVSLAVVALAVVLPMVVHLVAGPSGGATWLPMYLPVLLGGCLLGWAWGLGIGIASPLVSFAITSALGNAMPAAARLPFMVVELAVFAAVAGAFSPMTAKRSATAFAAVPLAQICGRAAFLLMALVLQSNLTVQVAWSQIVSGLWGLALQAVVVPLLVMAAGKLLKAGSNEQ